MLKEALQLLFVIATVTCSSDAQTNNDTIVTVQVSYHNATSSTESPRSMFSSNSPPRGVTLGFAMREVGMLECTGVDHLTGGKFFERIMGQGADASGDYLCQPTCGGECVPNQAMGVAPTSFYPFGCRCNVNRCNAEGPIVTQFGSGRFKIICARDTRCTCEGINSNDVHHVGYLCNWINLTTQRAVSFLERPNRPHLHPTYSPIRWCSCCPQLTQSSIAATVYK